MQTSALCRSRRELSKEYLFAKFGFDTAENEPCKVCPLSAYRSPRCIVGNAAQRKQYESIRDEVGFRSLADPTAVGKWVPIFFNSGIDLSVEEDN